jgi:flagellar assembly protein FliH
MVTWQSEVPYSDASLAQNATVTPLLFDSIDCAGTSDDIQGENRVHSPHSKSDSDVEELLKKMEILHRTEVEEKVRQARMNEQAKCEEEYNEALYRERESVHRICEQFVEERKHYFERVEVEIVRLSLAIAARILHREVKLDPLLLRGIVQVALNQLQESSEVVLRVPSDDVESWLLHFQDAAKSAVTVEVVADDRLEAGACTLQTKLGSVNFGVEIQLAEVERGFFDLLKQRPA